MSDKTVNISQELHDKLEVKKAKNGTSIQWQVEKAIEEYLSKKK